MTIEHVHCTRLLDVPAKDVWSILSGFDIGWHPMVCKCIVTRNSRGGVMRDFETLDGGRLVEQRTYISDTDRVLCYTALSGIEGALRYSARVEVAQEGEQSVVRWSAEISARADRATAIAKGTKSVFEAALDALPEAGTKPTKQRQFVPSETVITRSSIEGVPRLSFLSGPVTKAKRGTLILMLHGIGGQAANWTDQIQALGQDYCIAALDFRGYGQSKLGFAQSQIDDYCDDICAIADHFGATKLVLVGLSMGSWIATSFAMRHGDKLRGLVLAGGCTGMSEADPREREAFLKSREVPLAQGKKPADFATVVVDAISGPNASDQVRSILHQSMSDIATETYRDALNCFCNPLEKFDFAKIQCPVLLMTGAHDKLAPPTEIRRVSERIFEHVQRSGTLADVRFEVLGDAGHVCNLEQPALFNVHLGQFLDRLPGVAENYKPSREEKQREKRERILAAAHTEFCEVGFDGASMDRLAQAADVSKPTLYQYFGDKEGLLAAVLEQGRAHIIAPLAQNEGTLVDRLWQFSWTYAEFVLRPDMLSLARLILGEAGRRPQNAINYHQRGPESAFEGLVEFVRASASAGELRVDDPRMAANDLWSLILSGPRDHYLHYVQDRPSEEELLEAIGHGLSVFLKVYSCNPQTDHDALQLKITSRQSAFKKAEG